MYIILRQPHWLFRLKEIPLKNSVDLREKTVEVYSVVYENKRLGNFASTYSIRQQSARSDTTQPVTLQNQNKRRQGSLKAYQLFD